MAGDLFRSARFAGWLGSVRPGRDGPARLAGGALLLAVAHVVMIGLVVALIVVLLPLAGRYGLSSIPFSTIDQIAGDAMRSVITLFVVLLAYGVLWGALWTVLRWVHGQPLKPLLGPHGGWKRDFLRAAAATLIVYAAFDGTAAAFDPQIQRTGLAVWRWLLLFIPLAGAILVQSGAEEAIFRGYFLQKLAINFRSPVIWAAGPSLLFAVLHWSPAHSGPYQVSLLVQLFVLALLLTALVVRTGSLAAAIGIHFANNVAAILFIAPETKFQAALYAYGGDLGAMGWRESALQLVLRIGAFAAMWLLLVWPRSPFALDAARSRR